jgi:hypothetical protein
MSISKVFTLLVSEPTGHSFTVTPIPQHEGIYIGIDQTIRPCLFVTARDRLTEPNLRTARISLHLNQKYQLIFTDGSSQTDVFHALVCETTEHTDRETFFVLADAFLAQNNDITSASQSIVPFFRSMARLFAVDPALDLGAERQGLWGELFMMRQVCGYQFWAPFWHNEVRRIFDFSAPGKHLEVKTAAGGKRIHHFSHRQVYSLEGEEIIVASLLVRDEDTGLSLRELIAECRFVLQQSPYILKLERAVRHAGMEDPAQVGPIFNQAEAIHELRWFRSIDAPHFCLPEPPGVSQTSYRVDLSNAPQLDLDELKVWLDSWFAKD